MWRIFNQFARGAEPMSPKSPKQGRKRAPSDDARETRQQIEGAPPTDDPISPISTGEGSRSGLRPYSPKPITPLSQRRSSQIEHNNEPAYVEHDAEVRDDLWRITDRIEEFAKEHFAFDIPNNCTSEKFRKLCSSMSIDLKLIVGCIGVGGPGGTGGWKELFMDKELRQALVCGVIGNVLVEQREKVHRVQADHKPADGKDGFLRTQEYYKAIKQFLRENDLPAAFESHAIETTTRLYTLLVPILALNPSYNQLSLNINADSTTTTAEQEAAELLTAPWDIVTRAAVLSVPIRLDPDAVYYFAPTSKDDWYDPQAMECFNMKTMEASHPQKRTWAVSEDPAEKKRAQGDEPPVKIVCMDGCTAYRQGGWLMFGQPEWKKIGFRSQRLTEAWVACRWGRKRKWVKGKPVDKEICGVKWVEPGFVEFRNVVEKIEERVFFEQSRETFEYMI